MNNPIFILGCPRSGTTLLASLLNNSIYGRPVETHFITKYYKMIKSYGDLKEIKNLRLLLKHISNERPIKQWKIEIDVNRFYDQLESYTYEEVVHLLCMKMAAKKGFKSWGDKTPHYLLDIEIIYKLFPDSKCLYIVRDGRDVALSLLREPWGPNNIFSCAELWKKYNIKNEIIDQMKYRKQVFFLRYEDLLNNSEEIVPEIYEFLDEEYRESDMDKLIKGIKKGNYNKWKKKMSKREIKVFENIAADTLTRFGYETSFKETGVHGLVSSIYKLHGAFMRAKYLFKVNVIDGIKIRYFGKEPFAE